MPFGVQDRILRVNLSTGAICVENPGVNFYRQYFGGRGIIAYYLMRELQPGVDPLGPENKLIFAGGPVTGTAFIGSGRNSVGAKSPLTGAYGDAEAGGFFGAELRRAGYDALIIEGEAEKPVYLWIKDDQVEIRSAEHLWGQKTGPVQDAIKAELGDKMIRVAQIGPGGENLVKFACITNDLTHFYGRTGMGAVMGSKKLRAVAVRGTRAPELAHPDKMKELNQWMAQNWQSLAGNMHVNGTTAIVMGQQATGGLPTRNFREGAFEGAEKISHIKLNEELLIEREGCWSCPIRCKRVVKAEAPYKIDPTYGGPEYETLGSLGSCCGVDDIHAVCKGNELCNSLGLDTISTGVTISFAMECFEQGLINEEKTEGVKLEFGNGQAMVDMIEKIAYREGFGALLAEGSKRAAAAIGNGAEQYAMETKGLEVPMHEPRLKQGLGIGYAVSPTGADHCHNFHDTAYAKDGPGLESARSIGVSQPVPIDDLGSEKTRNMIQISLWRHFCNMAEYCQFLPWSYVQVEAALRAATGWDVSLYEMMKASERVVTLTRMFNLREGFTQRDDYLNKRFYKPLASLKDKTIDEEAMEKAIATYYAMMGWDESGRPTLAKLQELGIEWAAK